MNIIVAKNHDARPVTVVCIVPDNVNVDDVRRKLSKHTKEEWDLSHVTGDLIEVCDSAKAVAKALE